MHYTNARTQIYVSQCNVMCTNYNTIFCKLPLSCMYLDKLEEKEITLFTTMNKISGRNPDS